MAFGFPGRSGRATPAAKSFLRDHRGEGNISPSEIQRRIFADFKEMPDLHVTHEQGARLWNIGVEDARAGLTALVEKGVLSRKGRVYRRHAR